mgnify:CR=1 FL=1
MMNRKMIKQAQESQKNMARMQEELEASTVEGTSGGGVVKDVVNGKMTLESLVIDPDAVSADDVEILQDLILAAVNDGIEKSQNLASSRMNEITGGLNIPGLT